MPLNEKGQKILAEMKKEYGAEKGEEVFYASINAGAVTGVIDSRGDRTFFASDLTANISETPEGYLVCRNVPIGRTGDQIYYKGEPPFIPDAQGKYLIEPDQNGAISVSRPPDEVFQRDSLTSWEGKAVTIGHPAGFVTPDNWSDLAVGIIQNPRRGDGLENDVVMADLVLTHRDAIQSLKERGYRWEVSGGYNADYIPLGPGRGMQTNIRGNHVALVEKGRCGALCAIHDSQGGETNMKWYQPFFDALPEPLKKKFRDEAEAKEKELEEEKEKREKAEDKKARDARGKDGEGSVEERLSRLEAAIEKLLKSKEGEDKRAADARARDEEEAEKKKKEDEEKMAAEGKDCYGKTGDGASEMQDVLYRASILAPDMRTMTADALGNLKEKSFKEECCGIKRRALTEAMRTTDGQEAVKPFTSGKGSDFLTMDCKTVDTAFVGASELLKARRGNARVGVKTSDFGKSTRVADINQRNRDFWAKHKAN